MSNINVGGATWSQIANEQAWKEIENATGLNSTTMITKFDPVYGKLVELISQTIYRKLSTTQRLQALGTTNPSNGYTGMIREIMMLQRKGRDFPMDRSPRPTTMYQYPIQNDEIELRYHSSQIRWLYDYTIFDEELRRFSGGGTRTITQLTEMKAINMITARNLFMDTFRKKLFQILIDDICIEYSIKIDISNFETLTKEAAQTWLSMVDSLLFELRNGTMLYNHLAQYMQVPKSQLQMVMPYNWYKNVMRRAYPETYHTEEFRGILPENLILVDNLGTEVLVDAGGTPIETPTFNNEGMNLLTWDNTMSTAPKTPDVTAVIMDKASLTFEDNLTESLTGVKDIRKLVTPVANHFWTKGYVTDLTTSIAIVNRDAVKKAVKSSRKK